MAQAVFTSLAIQKIKVKRQDDATKKATCSFDLEKCSYL